MRVGIGMISRGEVGLIVAGVGVSSGVLTGSVYSTIVIMVAVTTIITPLWLKMEYTREVNWKMQVLILHYKTMDQMEQMVMMKTMMKTIMKKITI